MESAGRPYSAAAVAAIVLAVLGLAYFPLAALGFGFGVAGLLRTRRGVRRGRGLAVVALLVAPLTALTAGFELSRLARDPPGAGVQARP
ncbi:MAG: hypothetical protein ACYDCL_01815 [Myxococcales bacterium]